MEQNCPENLLQCHAEPALICPKNPTVENPRGCGISLQAPLSPSLPIYLSNLPSIHSISFSLDRCITTVLYVLPRARPSESGPRCCNPKSTKTEIVSPFCGRKSCRRKYLFLPFLWADRFSRRCSISTFPCR